MKCPINRGKYPFEGGDACDKDCGIALKNNQGDVFCSVAVIAAALAEREGFSRPLVNTMKEGIE